MNVAVVGQGTTALQAVAELAQIAKSVNAIGTPTKLIESNLGQKLKADGKVKFLTDYDVVEIRGKATVDGIVIRSKTDKSEQTLPVQGVFIEMGYETEGALYSHMVKTTADGRIMISETTKPIYQASSQQAT
jgi:thioredoxin reductase